VAAIDGLGELAEERLSTRVVVANPFAGMTVGPRVDPLALAEDAPAMMVACGLAMRGTGR
jgi:type IV pilus assembly protein PilM